VVTRGSRHRRKTATNRSQLGNGAAGYSLVVIAGNAGLLMSSTVGWLSALAAIGIFALLFVVPVLALRKHNRMFPKGWDRTGWEPEPGKARRFETMWTYFSGGRGGG
jgi:hypothetical protein